MADENISIRNFSTNFYHIIMYEINEELYQVGNGSGDSVRILILFFWVWIRILSSSTRIHNPQGKLVKFQFSQNIFSHEEEDLQKRLLDNAKKLFTSAGSSKLFHFFVSCASFLYIFFFLFFHIIVGYGVVFLR